MSPTQGAPRARKRKRKVVVYSAAEKQYCGRLLAGFAERHPDVEVDFRFNISVALHRRYLDTLAAGTPEADVMWSSAMDLQMGIVLGGGALPHASAEAHALPAGAVCRDLAYATTAEPLMTLVHRERFDVRMPAGSIGEIAGALAADPARLRGRVACYDIEANGLGFLALLHESRRRAEFDRFLDALTVCRPQIYGSNPALVGALTGGDAAICWHVLASYALRAVRAHAPLALAISNAPRLAVSRVAFIPAGAPHPDAARLFLDYLLSQDGQERLREDGLFPIREDVGPRAPAAEGAVPIRIDRDVGRLTDEALRRELLGRWRGAVGGRDAPVDVTVRVTGSDQ
jgi:iron(III) transport system substrate-binding protein